jgi:hypothetical protein
MLRALKIQAHPVLVHGRRRHELAQLQPSATLFNHAIVQVNLGGQTFWLDPTRTHERGSLQLHSWPDYGCGLVVSPATTDLTAIPPCPVQPLTTVTEYLNVGSYNSASTLKIVTVAEGRDADALRTRFATTPRADIEREDLNGLARIYPLVHATAPLDYTDDEQENRVETTEYYSIDKIWSRLPDQANYHCRIYSVNVDDALEKPEVSFRTMPLGLHHPVHQVFHADVTVAGLPITPSNITINNAAFYFQRTVNVAGNRLLLDYEYRSLADSVPTASVQGYLHDLDTAMEALGYTVFGGW